MDGKSRPTVLNLGGEMLLLNYMSRIKLFVVHKQYSLFSITLAPWFTVSICQSENHIHIGIQNLFLQSCHGETFNVPFPILPSSSLISFASDHIFLMTIKGLKDLNFHHLFLILVLPLIADISSSACCCKIKISWILTCFCVINHKGTQLLVLALHFYHIFWVFWGGCFHFNLGK